MERLDVQVPRSLDEMPRMLLLDAYQAMLLLSMLGLGIVCGYILAGSLAGVAAAYAYGRLKAGRHPQFLMHLAYWHLPPRIIRLERTPPSHFRLYSG